MDEKKTFDALGQAPSNIKIEDDGTADRKILIALAFGTTFSGVAWAQTRRVRISACHGKALVHADILTRPMCSLSSFNGQTRPLEDLKG